MLRWLVATCSGLTSREHCCDLLTQWPINSLTLLVPVSYQQPTYPYITHTKYDIWWWENENWSNKANYWRLKVKFSQVCSMKSMGSGWENLTIQLALKGLNTDDAKSNSRRLTTEKTENKSIHYSTAHDLASHSQTERF